MSSQKNQTINATNKKSTPNKFMVGAGSAPQNATTAKKRARIVKNSLRTTTTLRGALAFRHKQKVRQADGPGLPGYLHLPSSVAGSCGCRAQGRASQITSRLHHLNASELGSVHGGVKLSKQPHDGTPTPARIPPTTSSW